MSRLDRRSLLIGTAAAAGPDKRIADAAERALDEIIAHDTGSRI
ncbi:hypothetical protein [Gordonia sp. NPDC127522]